MGNMTLSVRLPRRAGHLLRVAARLACIALLALPLAFPAPAAGAAAKHRKAPVKHKHAAKKYRPAAVKHPKARPAAKKAAKKHRPAPRAAKKAGAAGKMHAVEKPRQAGADRPQPMSAARPRAPRADEPQAVDASKPRLLGTATAADAAPSATEDLPPPRGARSVCRRGDRIYLLADCGAAELPAALAAGPADAAPSQLQ